jgi:hypothetical protein
MLLIGSKATQFWHPEYRIGQKSDWDVLVSHDKAEEITQSSLNPCASSWRHGDRVELHNVAFLNNADILRYATEERIEIEDGLCPRICSSRGLAAIKRGHLHRSLGFTKHMIQYQILDKDFGLDDWQFIWSRASLTKSTFGDRAGFKDKGNKEFFDDAVTRPFSHDDLHLAIAKQPLYLKIKSDPSKAAYDPYLWIGLPYWEKTEVVREECYVIALERWLIPYRQKERKYPYSMAFHKAMEKACTTLDNGPFREYAIDNWSKIQRFNPAVLDCFFNSQLWQNHELSH